MKYYRRQNGGTGEGGRRVPGLSCCRWRASGVPAVYPLWAGERNFFQSYRYAHIITPPPAQSTITQARHTKSIAFIFITLYTELVLSSSVNAVSYTHLLGKIRH